VTTGKVTDPNAKRPASPAVPVVSSRPTRRCCRRHRGQPPGMPPALHIAGTATPQCLRAPWVAGRRFPDQRSGTAHGPASRHLPAAPPEPATGAGPGAPPAPHADAALLPESRHTSDLSQPRRPRPRRTGSASPRVHACPPRWVRRRFLLLRNLGRQGGGHHIPQLSAQNNVGIGAASPEPY
jgi:hypothetical protein